MKILNLTLAMSLMLLAACQKSEDGGGGGGSGQPATQVPPTQAIVNNPGFYDNHKNPYVGNDDYQLIFNKKMQIYNNDGFENNRGNCDSNPAVICMANGQKRMAKDFAMASTPAYLSCINNNRLPSYSVVMNFDFRRAHRDQMSNIYRSSSHKRRNTREETAINCASAHFDKTSIDQARFEFDQNGRLSFTTILNGFEYRGINIGYKYNVVTRQISIGAFLAQSRNPNGIYLSISTISTLKGTRNSPSMLLRKSNAADMSDDDSMESPGSFRFEEALVLRLSNSPLSRLTYKDYMSSAQMNYQQMNGNYQMNSNFPNQNPQMVNQNPQMMSNQVPPLITPQSPQLLIIGGNVEIISLELLPFIDSTKRTNGTPNYDDFDDGRI